MHNLTGGPCRLPMLIGILLLSVSTMSFAQNDEDKPMQKRGERCVSLTRIDHTDVLDDQNILFYMLGKQIYINKLPHKCNGLARADSYMYKTSLSQLCDLDIITVLNTMGFGFMRGPSCGLGTFYPIDKDRVKELKGQKAPGSERLEPVKE